MHHPASQPSSRFFTARTLRSLPSSELRKGDTWSAGDVNKLLAALRSWMEMGEITKGVISTTGEDKA